MNDGRPRRVFDEHYRERFTLRSGARISFQAIRPKDKQTLLAAFERMSIQSRLSRFFWLKDSLTESDLRYLTELDGEDHFAIAAGRRQPDGILEGLGTARLVRDKDDPSSAEFAVTVIDDWQGKGLGRALLLRLTAAARERGITQFVCSVLPDNEPMLALVRAYPDHTYTYDEHTIDYRIDLRSADLSRLPWQLRHRHRSRFVALGRQGRRLARRSLRKVVPEVLRFPRIG